MKLKFGAAIILYNPTQEQINNINIYQKVFNTLFIFDNSDLKQKKNYNFGKYENIIYLTKNKNMGLPYAFNNILSHDKCKELDFLCTLDQDSIFPEKEIKKMQIKIENTNNLNNYGIFSPYIYYGFNNNYKYDYKDNLINKKWVITSGSFINLKILYENKINYDENYFIDKCDIDLCKQFISKNYLVCIYLNSILYQKLGDNDKKNHSNHSIIRHYYIYRNRFYFNNKWYNPIKKYILNFLQTIKQLLLIIIYENNKKEKVLILKKAVKDYKNKKMEKIYL